MTEVRENIWLSPGYVTVHLLQKHTFNSQIHVYRYNGPLSVERLLVWDKSGNVVGDVRYLNGVHVWLSSSPEGDSIPLEKFMQP